MGHNSITDFWDTEQHLFRDPQRERFYSENHLMLQNRAWNQEILSGSPATRFAPSEAQAEAKERAVQAYLDRHSYVAKPYQDVSCRLQGPVLYDLNHNFCQAWQESERPSSLFMDFFQQLTLSVTDALASGVKAVVNLFHDEVAPDFIQRRQKIDPKSFNFPNGEHSVQLLRTQPMHGEKAIKECYANLTRQTLHYIFIQNQYIQYAPWAEHLIDCVSGLRLAGYYNPIYVFMLTSTPEKDGMDLPTYDVASKVGRFQIPSATLG